MVSSSGRKDVQNDSKQLARTQFGSKGLISVHYWSKASQTESQIVPVDSRAHKKKFNKKFLSGHEFLQINYHMPTTCEICPKPLWHMFRPPAAYECKR